MTWKQVIGYTLIGLTIYAAYAVVYHYIIPTSCAIQEYFDPLDI